jgi:transcriptional regulator with XRE-family HTH domain
VIQNIESGRKKDISVAQLLDISKALGISPLFLLVRIGDPAGKVDLDNVGADVASMTSAQMDRWISKSEPAESDHAERARAILRHTRRLLEEVPRFRELRATDVSQLRIFEYEDSDGDGNTFVGSRDEVEAYRLSLAQAASSLIFHAKFLASSSVDLAWARDDIEEATRTLARVKDR